jgi:hypothetical protein
VSILTRAEVLIAVRRLAGARPHLAAVAGIVHREDLWQLCVRDCNISLRVPFRILIWWLRAASRPETTQISSLGTSSVTAEETTRSPSRVMGVPWGDFFGRGLRVLPRSALMSVHLPLYSPYGPFAQLIPVGNLNGLAYRIGRCADEDVADLLSRENVLSKKGAQGA